uniref:Uncoordinated protein 79 n=1 Tax=Pristionchus pacificus TaxID=54126 RepID=A0A8R1UE95_PRIPA
MGTKAATFSSKIRTLSDFQARILNAAQEANKTPSSAEIIATLRYFQCTLVSFLKELPPGTQLDFVRRYSSDSSRASLCPNLNYSGLFYAINNLLDVFHLIPTAQKDIAEAIVETLKALIPFLDRDSLDQLPVLLASQLGVFPPELHKTIVHIIADCVLPFSLTPDSITRISIPAVLMLIFQHTPDPTLHTWIIESAMAHTEGIYRDVIAVLSKGTSPSRVTAANLLFHYWPFSNPHVLHRKLIQYKVHAWTPIACQYGTCAERGPSVKKCYEPSICSGSVDTAPPIFVCRKCSEAVQSEGKVQMETLLQPMSSGCNATTCQNKSCSSSSRIAVATCFSTDCVKHHNFVPIRVCAECLDRDHHSSETEYHLTHSGSGVVWGSDMEWEMIEAIVKLLRETSHNLGGGESEGKRPKWLRQLEGGQQAGKEVDKMSDERRMLSRFGIWLMAALCPPVPEANERALHYVMEAVFEWFATTALLPNDNMGSSLEQLKTEFVSDWLNLAIRNHYDVFVDVLSPAAVREVEDRPRVEEMKEALGKLLSLTPYDIVSLETWSRVMPKWLQCIYDNSEEEHLRDLKIVLSKIFEPDLCPLPFDTPKVFEFITRELVSGDFERMNCALKWIHQLSRMEIRVPLGMLLTDLSECFKLLPTMDIPKIEEGIDLDDDDVCTHVVVIDILVMQFRLNEISTHEMASTAEKLFSAMALLLRTPMQVGAHVCHSSDMDEFADCNPCQQAAFFYQMVLNLVSSVSPKQEMLIESREEDVADLAEITSPSASLHSQVLSPYAPSMQQQPSPSLLAPPGSSSMVLHRANVVDEGDEYVGILPTEEIESAMAETTTLTEKDVGRETCHVLMSTLVQGKTGSTPMLATSPSSRSGVENECFWETSVGRFKFSFDSIPSQLRFIFALYKNLDGERDPDVELFILQTLKILCLHCEVMTNSRREHRGFLIWMHEHIIVPKLWTLLRSDYIQVGEVASLLLIHACTFPSGEEMLWRIVPKHFTSSDWKIRFDAVGRSTVFFHLARPSAVKSNKVVQYALAHLFFHLTTSTVDPNPAVAQRALTSLRALPSGTLRLLTTCVESQFDACIIDRPLLIHSMRTLATQVPEEPTLSFDFFIQLFETLVLEAQLAAQNEDSLFVQDLSRSDPMSEIYQRKVTKAKRAIENAATARSISKTLAGKGMKHQLFFVSHDLPTDSGVHSPSVVSPQGYSSSGGFARLREFTDQESNMCLMMNRVVDMANPERHTVYLTVSLFVTFLSNNKMNPSSDEKQIAKKQSVLFRHFNTLLGYSNTEKCFTIPPARLRKSAVCNAFLSGIPEILDQNLTVGNQILPIILQLLVHLPSPQKLASDQQSATYSLSLLSQHQRHLWLNSMVLVLYKYRFDQATVSEYIIRLIGILLKTLQNHSHECVDESEESKEITAWSVPMENSDNEEEKLTRPESLTVTSIAEESDECIRMVPSSRKSRHKESSSRAPSTTSSSQAQIDLTIILRCERCNDKLEVFDEESISLSLIALSTFLQRETAMAAPMLLKIIQAVTRVVHRPLYPWHDSEVFVIANCRSVAKQIMRVILHQLSTSGIALQLFDSPLKRDDPLWSVVVYSLNDFTDLSPVSFLQLLFEDLSEEWPSSLSLILRNLSLYIVHVSPDSFLNQWNNLITAIDTFFRTAHSKMTVEGGRKPTAADLHNAITVVTTIMRVQNYSSFKSSVTLAESFGKWMGEALHDSPVLLEDLLGVCTACNRALIREREKQTLSRAMIAELMQAIRFKCSLHAQNYLTIARMILQDSGEDVDSSFPDDEYNTAASEAVRPHLFEIIDFIADLHVLAKLKKEVSEVGDAGDIKVWLAEIVAVEMSRSSARDCRTVIRFIPWLMSPPSVTQAPPGAFADSVTNVRVLSWLLLGALSANTACLPVPIECSQHMADYIHFVLAGFADQSKQSVVHMSALFHAFHLCQLWTVYCERASTFSSPTAFSHLLDFWSRVTPAILQLLSHSKVLADMVNLHFLNTMQALQSVNSALLCRLYAMWSPILTAYHSAVPNQLRMKLDATENQPTLTPPPLTEWLKKVRFKIAQVELQTSAASPFYNV